MRVVPVAFGLRVNDIDPLRILTSNYLLARSRLHKRFALPCGELFAGVKRHSNTAIEWCPVPNRLFSNHPLCGRLPFRHSSFTAADILSAILVMTGQPLVFLPAFWLMISSRSLLGLMLYQRIRARCLVEYQCLECCVCP